MKRIVLFFIVGILFIGKSLGQVDNGYYSIRLDGYVTSTYDDGCGLGCQRIKLIPNGGDRLLWPPDGLGLIDAGDILLDDSRVMSYSAPYSYTDIKARFPAKSAYSHLYFYGWRGCNKTATERHVFYSIWNKYPYANVRITEGDKEDGYLISDHTCDFRMLLQPEALNLFYFDSNGKNTNGQLLPSADKITLKATKDFPEVVYKWVYSIVDVTYQDGSSTVFAWTSFPSRDGITYNADKSEVSFSGLDILSSEDFSDLIKEKKKLLVKIGPSDLPGSIGTFSTHYEMLHLTPMYSAPHIVSVTPIQERCNGSLDGQLDITLDRDLYPGEKFYLSIMNSDTGYMEIREGDEFSVDPTNKKNVILYGLSAGSYDIGLKTTYLYGDTYNEGEEHFYSTSIPERDKVTFTIKSDPVHCYDGSDGNIRVTAHGGVGKYNVDLFKKGNLSVVIRQMTIDENTTTAFPDGLKAGDYVVQLADTNYCNVPEQAVTVGQPAAPLKLYNFQYQEPSGNGRSDGEAWISITGGTGDYTVEWKNANNTGLTPEPLVTVDGVKQSRLKGLKKGEYYVYVNDQNYEFVDPKTLENECGCIAADTIFIDEPPGLSVDISERHYITGNGDNDGVLVAHGRGGSPYLPFENTFPYIYKWYKEITPGNDLYIDTNANDSVLANISSGHYKVNIIDRNGVEATSAVFNLVQPDSLEVTVKVLQGINCKERNIGRAEVSVKGGTGPYSYFWETGATTPMVEGLSEGTYEVIVYDSRYPDNNALSCTQRASVEIRIPEPPKVTIITEPDPVHCYDGSDGNIRVNVQGDVGKYYAYLFKKDNLSVVIRQMTIDENTTTVFTGLKAGDYVVQLVDTNYCQPDVPEHVVAVGQPAAPLKLDIIRLQGPSGNGRSDGEAWISITGGTEDYTVAWKNADTGVLTPEPLIEVDGVKQSRLKGLKKGEYYVYVNDQNYEFVDPKTLENECGCIAADTIFIDEPPGLSVDISERHYITGNGDNDGVLVAHGRGGSPYLPFENTFPYIYKWYKEITPGNDLYIDTNANDSVLANISSGHYKVNITDRNGVEATSAVFNLVQPDSLEVTVKVLQGINCKERDIGRAEVSVKGGTGPYSYFWERGDTTPVVEGLSEGTYEVIVYDSRYPDNNALSCTQRASVEIRIPEPPKVTITTEPDPVHCYDGSDGHIWVNVQGSVDKYKVDLLKKDNPSVVIRQMIIDENTTTAFPDGLKAGDYVVQLVDTNYCNVPEQAVTVGQPAAPLKLDIIRLQGPSGNGRSDGEAWISITGGTEDYIVEWKNANNTGVLTPEPLIEVDGVKQSRLKGLKKGEYYVYVNDQNYEFVDPKTLENECGCIAADTIFIDEPSALSVEISERHYITYNGDKDGVLVAHGRGGSPFLSSDGKPFPYEYEWSKAITSGDSIYKIANDSVLANISSGRYKVKITDRNGVETTSAVFNLIQPDPLEVTVKVLQGLNCTGEGIGQAEVVVTGGTKPYSYFWERGDTTCVIKELFQGIYSVVVRDGRYLDSKANYRTKKAFVEIDPPNGMDIKATIKEPSCHSNVDGSIDLVVTGGVAPYAYLWNDETKEAVRKGLAAGKYEVAVTDANDCKVIAKYTLEEPAALVANIGDDFTLCKDQSVTLNGSLGIDSIAYRWTKDGTEVSTDSLYKVNSAGVYRLTVTNRAGCTAYDEVVVKQSDNELVADFVVASKIPNNANVYAINITRTNYDRVDWLMPAEAVILEQTDDQVQFSISKNGYYMIGLAGYRGQCKNILYKRIEVVNKGDINEYNESEPFLRTFTVYPNPDEGNFKVSVELREATDYTLSLSDGQSAVIETKEITNSAGKDTVFDMPGKPGVYYLRFVSKEMTSVFKIMTN